MDVSRRRCGCADAYGNQLEPEQDTPIASLKKGMHVHFGYRVHIHTSLKKMKECTSLLRPRGAQTCHSR